VDWQTLPAERRSGEATAGDERTADGSAVVGQEAAPKRKMYGRTKPEALLKHHIPVKTDRWDVKGAGFVGRSSITLQFGQGGICSAELKQLPSMLDPFELSRSIEGKLESIYALANRRPGS
jgi:hypothetical protein